MVADVVVENASYSFDIPFSYRVPGRMEGQMRPGCRVLVPFGRSNRSKQGLVLRLQPQDPQSQQLKPIKLLLDQKPLLGEEQLWLLELLHQRTFCTYYEGLRALVPSGLTFRLKLMCSLGEARPQQPTDKQRQLLDYLSAKKKPDCCATTAGRSFAARMPTGRRRIRHRSPSIPRSSRRWTVCGNSGSGEKAPPCCTV